MTYNLKFITPAFLCGANQSKAELRAPSVRGALRWWFRVLGGTREEEAQVFGGVHGGAQKSKVIVRCAEKNVVHKAFEKPAPMSDLGYLAYFATVSGERKGIRVEPDAYFAKDTTFEIQIGALGLEPQMQQKLDQAIDFFVHLGSLGLRATRGFGAFAEEEKLPTRSEFAQWVNDNAANAKVMVRLANDEAYPDAKKAMSALGGWLRAIRKETHCDGKHESAFGYSKGRERMSSALKLRPVQVKEGFLPVGVYTDEACSRGSQAEAVERASVAL
jgi:CRISPR type III-B/RAMP module RAMP protein Cmr1